MSCESGVLKELLPALTWRLPCAIMKERDRFTLQNLVTCIVRLPKNIFCLVSGYQVYESLLLGEAVR
jgi:hypothetical protein